MTKLESAVLKDIAKELRMLEDDLNEAKDTFNYVIKDKEANAGLQEASLIEVETGIGIKNYYN